MNFKIDKEIKDIYNNFISLLSSKIAVMAFTMISVVVTARFLGPSSYGMLSLLLGLVQFFYVASSGWTSNAVIRFGREELLKENSIKSVFWCRGIILSIGLLLIGIFIVIMQGALKKYFSIQKNDLYLVFLYLITFILADYGNYILQAFGHMRKFAFSAVLERLLYLALLGVFVVFPGKFSAFKTVFIIMITAKIIQAIFSFLSVDKKMLFPFIVDSKMLNKIIKYSLPVFLFFPTAYISEWGDLWVVKFYLPISMVGIYQIAYQALLSLTQVYMVTTVLFFPLITSLRSEGKEDTIKNFLQKISPQMVFIWSMAISLLVCVGDYILVLLFGANFMDAKQVFIILLSTATFVGISGIYSAVNASFDLLKYAMISSFITALINIGLDFMLIPVFGIKGAAFATLCAYSLNALFYMHIGNKKLGLKTPATIFAVSPAFLMLIVSLNVHNFIARITFFILIAAISVLLVKHLRFFKKQDLKIFEKIKKPKIVENIINHLYALLEGQPLETVGLQ
jgi:O-antigen/teichoic acid export membrane protein